MRCIIRICDGIRVRILVGFSVMIVLVVGLSRIQDRISVRIWDVTCYSVKVVNRSSIRVRN